MCQKSVKVEVLNPCLCFDLCLGPGCISRKNVFFNIKTPTILKALGPTNHGPWISWVNEDIEKLPAEEVEKHMNKMHMAYSEGRAKKAANLH